MTAEQMRALFGAVAPFGWLRQQQRRDRTSPIRISERGALGAPFRMSIRLRPFGLRWPSASRRQHAIGWPADASIARLTGRGCALRWHGSSLGRAWSGAVNARELAGQIAKVLGHERRRLRLRTDVLPGVRVSQPCCRSPTHGGGPSSNRRIRLQSRRVDVHRDACAVHPDRVTSVRQVMCGPGPPASPPGSRACDPDLHPTWRSRTVQTLHGGGYRSMGGCCSRPTWPPRRPTTPPSNITSGRP